MASSSRLRASLWGLLRASPLHFHQDLFDGQDVAPQETAVSTCRGPVRLFWLVLLQRCRPKSARCRPFKVSLRHLAPCLSLTCAAASVFLCVRTLHQTITEPEKGAFNSKRAVVCKQPRFRFRVRFPERST